MTNSSTDTWIKFETQRYMSVAATQQIIGRYRITKSIASQKQQKAKMLDIGRFAVPIRDNEEINRAPGSSPSNVAPQCQASDGRLRFFTIIVVTRKEVARSGTKTALNCGN